MASCFVTCIMRITNKVIACFFLLLLLTSGYAVAYPNGDLDNGRDHPLISRYDGSTIIRYDEKGFDEYLLPLGEFRNGRVSKTQLLQGKVTRIRYEAPKDASTLQIYLSYEMALTRAGFEILFSGKNEELGKDLDWPSFLFNRDLVSATRLMAIGQDQRCLVGKLPNSMYDIYVSIFISKVSHNSSLIQLDFIEVKPMEPGMVKVNLAYLAESIVEAGHVAIYSIYFDINKADIKPESEEAIEGIAEFLRKNEEINLYVIGHTDNTGTLDFNMELSQRRAEAVVDALVSEYNIDKMRLQPVGIGPLSPISTNRTDEGRSKNRRVELVER